MKVLIIGNGSTLARAIKFILEHQSTPIAVRPANVDPDVPAVQDPAKEATPIDEAGEV